MSTLATFKDKYEDNLVCNSVEDLAFKLTLLEMFLKDSDVHEEMFNEFISDLSNKLLREEVLYKVNRDTLKNKVCEKVEDIL